MMFRPKGTPMTLLKTLLTAAALALIPALAQANDGLHLHDPYARLTPQTGAVYVLIQNKTGTDDRLIAARSDMADMTMLMTSTEVDGVSSMQALPDGFVIPAGGVLVLQSGAGHVMLMGLKGKLHNGDTFPLTLTFANSGDVTLTVPVMSARAEPPADVVTAFDSQTGDPAPAPAPDMQDMPGMTMTPKGSD